MVRLFGLRRLVPQCFTALFVLSQDNYACELFLLLSKERELCELVERFLQIRQDRFIKSQSLLSTVLPKLERQLACSSTGPVYGIRLDQHLKLSQKVSPN